jgi:Flp pilus assembly protein CpaB
MKSRLLRISLAAVIAILAASLAYQLSGGSAGVTSAKASQVYVVKALIQRGTTLQSAIVSKLVKLETYPDASLPSDAITQEAAKGITSPSSTDLNPGTILTKSQFLEDAALTSITGLEPGMVAVTGNFKIEESVAGLIAKGDSVAVYATFQNSGSSNAVSKTKMIIPMSRVVLVGQSGATDSSPSGSQLVTLSLDPQDAAYFIHAAKTASMQLVLLRPGEVPNTPKSVSTF